MISGTHLFVKRIGQGVFGLATSRSWIKPAVLTAVRMLMPRANMSNLPRGTACAKGISGPESIQVLEPANDLQS
jgi:hypothetical protein